MQMRRSWETSGKQKDRALNAWLCAETWSARPEVVLPIVVATDCIHAAEKEKQNPVPDWQ